MLKCVNKGRAIKGAGNSRGSSFGKTSKHCGKENKPPSRSGFQVSVPEFLIHSLAKLMLCFPSQEVKAALCVAHQMLQQGPSRGHNFLFPIKPLSLFWHFQNTMKKTLLAHKSFEWQLLPSLRILRWVHGQKGTARDTKRPCVRQWAQQPLGYSLNG